MQQPGPCTQARSSPTAFGATAQQPLATAHLPRPCRLSLRPQSRANPGARDRCARGPRGGVPVGLPEGPLQGGWGDKDGGAAGGTEAGACLGGDATSCGTKPGTGGAGTALHCILAPDFNTPRAAARPAVQQLIAQVGAESAAKLSEQMLAAALDMQMVRGASAGVARHRVVREQGFAGRSRFGTRHRGREGGRHVDG